MKKILFSIIALLLFMGIANASTLNKVVLADTDVTFEIKTKTDGNGTIKAEKEMAISGEQIKITATPNKGFVLNEIKVTDSEGNVITYKNNTFVMPASSVLVEATFTPTNPKTGDIAVLWITLLAIGSAYILLTQKRKLDFLK